MTSITQNAKLRRGLRFKLANDPGGKYDVICIANETTDGAPEGAVRTWDGDSIAYMMSCNGLHRAVGQRICDLLNQYGLVEGENNNT